MRIAVCWLTLSVLVRVRVLLLLGLYYYLLFVVFVGARDVRPELWGGMEERVWKRTSCSVAVLFSSSAIRDCVRVC